MMQREINMRINWVKSFGFTLLLGIIRHNMGLEPMSYIPTIIYQISIIMISTELKEED